MVCVGVIVVDSVGNSKITGSNLSDDTIMARSHAAEDPYGAVVLPVYRSVVYRFTGTESNGPHGRPWKYGREDNPTVAVFERVMASLEGGEAALAFNSGMAALATILLGLVEPGTTVILWAHTYGTTLHLLRLMAGKIGYKLELAIEPNEVVEKASCVKGRKLVFVESISNPFLYMVDITELAKVCRESNCILVVDNTFASPVLLKPSKLGAHLVLESVTKYIAGHNDVLGGVVVGDRETIDGVLWDWRRSLGSVMQADAAYLAMRGLKTLRVRLEKQSRSAQQIAEFLADHPKVSEVYYLGLPSHPSHNIARRLLIHNFYGGVISFRVKGDKEAVQKLFKRLKIITPSPSLGGVESLISYPIASSHLYLPEDIRRKLGITEDLVRLSVGLEDVDDLIEDLDNALAGI